MVAGTVEGRMILGGQGLSIRSNSRAPSGQHRMGEGFLLCVQKQINVAVVAARA